jgi:aryl-alcohol dehydrogenase-like predicted oxidoreductase
VEDLERTLDRMGTDRLDLWLFHRDDASVPADELADAAASQVAAGLVDAWGVSNWTVERLREARDATSANGWAPPAATSPHFSLVQQIAEPWPGVVSIAGPDSAEDRQWLTDAGIPVLAWSSLAGGYLTNGLDLESLTDPETSSAAEAARCYHSADNWARRQRAVDLAMGRDCTLEQVAVAWVLAAPFEAHALCASRTGAEARTNLQASNVALSEAERSWLEGSEASE